MERDVDCELWNKASESGVKFSVYVGDDDSTTLADLKNKVPYGVEKIMVRYCSCPAHLKLKCRITQKNSVKFLSAPAALFGGVFLHAVERCSLTLERMVFLPA